MVVGITHRLWLLLRHMADQFSDELLEHMFRDWRPSVDSYGMGPTRRYLQAVMDGIGLGFYTSKEAPVPGAKKSVFELHCTGEGTELHGGGHLTDRAHIVSAGLIGHSNAGEGRVCIQEGIAHLVTAAGPSQSAQN